MVAAHVTELPLRPVDADVARNVLNRVRKPVVLQRTVVDLHFPSGTRRLIRCTLLDAPLHDRDRSGRVQ